MKKTIKLTALLSLLTLSSLASAQSSFQGFADKLYKDGCTGAIIASQDGTVLATNEAWPRVGEIKTILKGLSSGSLPFFKLEGSNYITLKASHAYVIAQRDAGMAGAFKVYIYRTTKSLIACTTYYSNESKAASKAKDLADYFVSNGY